MTQVFSDVMAEHMFRIMPTYASEFSSITTTMFQQDIWDRTRHWNSSGDIIPGQTYATMYKSSASLVLPICDPNHSVTDHMDPSNNFLSQNIHRIQFLWTSLRNSLPPPGLTLFQLQWIDCQNKPYSFLSMTPLLQQNQHVFSLPMSFQSMEFHLMLCLTVAPNLSLTSSVPQVPPWI